MRNVKKGVSVRRISPGDAHYFFGYYDLQPFNKSQNLHLAHKSTFMGRMPLATESADIGVIDVETGKFEKLDSTFAWNFQQGAMLQWNSLNPDNEIIYNSMVDGEYVGIVMDINNGKKRYLDKPVANVSRDGKYGLGINMSRLYDFRPGYGYAPIKDKYFDINHSDEDGVFLIDMETGKSKLVLSLQEIWDFSGSFYEKDQKIIVNHITFNTDASRFLMLVRNFPVPGKAHETASITVNRDGSDMFNLCDYGITSHYWWMNETDIVWYADGKELDCKFGRLNNYIVKDKTYEGTLMADGFFTFDNHMSFNGDNTIMLTDTYPLEMGVQTLRLYKPSINTAVDLGAFYSMKPEIVDARCDLHPRWNRSFDAVTFDSTHEGFRGIYKIDLPKDKMDSLFEE